MTVQFGNLIDSHLLLVTNRQPYRHEYDGDEVVVDQPGGGVVAGLDAVAREVESTWVAWGDGQADPVVTDEDGRIGVPPEDPTYTLNRVWLDEEDVAGYYEGYANRVLWPLCHTAPGQIVQEEGYWETYRKVNEQFADEIVDEVDDDTVVWFQDYHFTLAPAYVREEHPGTIAHFWHIPWPSVDVFRICPHRESILRGLLANDHLGFHIDRYCQQFLACVDAFVPEAEVDEANDIVIHENRQIQVDAFPLGVDVRRIREAVEDPRDIDRRMRRTHDLKGQLVLGVDRLDYSKGIPERLAALEYLWSTRPQMRESFTYIQKGMRSREGIPEYREVFEDVEEGITRINDEFGTENWQPIVRIEEFLPNEELFALYRSADVMLVTALRDGMNLVAQEYVAAQLDRDGVLILSEFAGGHEFLGSDAITVNPFDPVGVADGIERAIHMDALERIRRMRPLAHTVEELDVHQWIQAVLTTIASEFPESTTHPQRTNN